MAGFGLPQENFAGGTRISIFDDVGVFIEGHRGVITYTPALIEVRLGKSKLVLTGEKMRIAGINRYELYVVGKIIAASREN